MGEVIDNLLEEGKALKGAEIIDNIIKYMSCRGAIKAGEKLQFEEMESLITRLFKSSNPYRCPHGRPILIHLSDYDLEKGLGRK
jgi:DNA mismatch repair protein MutL